MATRPRTLLADRTKAPLPCLGSLPSHSHRRSGHRRDEYQCDFRYFARIPFLMQPGFVRAKLDPDAGQPSDLEPSRSIGGRRDRFRRLVTTALPPNETNWLEHDLRDRFSILVDPDSLRTRLDSTSTRPRKLPRSRETDRPRRSWSRRHGRQSREPARRPDSGRVRPPRGSGNAGGNRRVNGIPRHAGAVGNRHQFNAGAVDLSAGRLREMVPDGQAMVAESVGNSTSIADRHTGWHLEVVSMGPARVEPDLEPERRRL